METDVSWNGANSVIPVCIVGGGAAGLAAAVSLERRGVPTVVLERGPAVGTSWRNRYDRLHLHTTRRLSSLPGLSIPRRFGRFVARKDVVRYLDHYAEVYRLHVESSTNVVSVDPAPAPADGARWMITTDEGRQFRARSVIVATGCNNQPFLPTWPGLEQFTGQVVHASEYRNAVPYEGKSVLVVGVGNTGTEIAVDLAEGGAASVWLSMRTVPHIVRNTIGPWAAQMTGVLVRYMPTVLVDRIAAVLARVSIPDLSSFGLPRPAPDLYTRLKRDRSVPVQDVGIIDAIQRGMVAPVPGVVSFTSDEVILSDGRRLRPDVVLAATGYEVGLSAVLSPALLEGGVLTARGVPSARRGTASAAGLYFLGFTVSISGALRDIAIEARRIARAEAKDYGVVVGRPKMSSLFAAPRRRIHSRSARPAVGLGNR